MRWPGLVLLAACGGPSSDAPVDAPVAPPVDAIDAFVPPDAPGQLLLFDGFSTDGAWPGTWTMLGGVASATVAGARAQLVPVVSSYSLARMGHALTGAVDVDVRFDLTMTNAGTQGVGFYVRQNGGYLRQTATRGAGYAVFVEGFRGAQIGLWAERDGVEEELAPPFAPTTLVDNTVYNVRFLVRQESPTSTRLSAKIWPFGENEPAAWAIERSDDTPNLQNVAGGIAVDSYYSLASGTPSPITIDSIDVRAVE
jgi:hypothetical protein